MTMPTVDTRTTAQPKDGGSGSSSGPSWGLIIPIVMIGVFLLSVVICLWWHKWRDRKRTLHVQRNSNMNSNTFQRSYRGIRGSRASDLETIRDSTRSTTPLRNSMHEKISVTSSNSGYQVKKLTNVNVVPIQRTQNGKFSFYWDKNHWKAYQSPVGTAPRLSGGSKPLSPINEIDSPSSMKLSERSRNAEMSGQPSYASHQHQSWMVPSSGLPSYEQSMNSSHLDTSARYPPYPSQVPITYHYNGVDPKTNSPYFPNNNTPTTECDTSSDASHTINSFQGQVCAHCPPYINVNQLPSTGPTSFVTGSTEPEVSHSRSLGSSYPESSYETSCPSGFQTSTVPPSSGLSSITEHHSSLPSSIAQFSKENIMLDDNNNSSAVPNAYLSFRMARAMNFSLASSVDSTDTNFSDNTSLLPNMGSTNTSNYPTTVGSRSLPHSTEQSGRVSPEDLSKLVDEMSSIRPVEESTSTKPDTSNRHFSRIASISGNMSADFYRSWSGVASAEQPSLQSINISGSQGGSMYWDNYPICETQRPGEPVTTRACRSHLDLPLLLHANQPPILMEKQYWV